MIPMTEQPDTSNHLRSRVVIPARLASTRLPRKMLLAETGKPLVQHTYEAVADARRPDAVCIATDCEEIAATVRRFGGEYVMTSPDLASGTDRVAAAARALDDADVYVNVQGDEPEMCAEAVDAVIGLLARDESAVMATLAAPIRERALLHDPARVKVVFDAAGNALYFSRSPIPHVREWDDALLTAEPPQFYLHLGIYAYRRDFLLSLGDLPTCSLENLEKLEQLRVLHAGRRIRVGVIDHVASGIDTPEDYAAFVERYRGRLRKAG